MKRREMLDIIEDVVAVYCNDIRNVAEVALKACEIAGMLPPRRSLSEMLKRQKSPIETQSGDIVDGNTDSYFGWERE